MRFSGTIKVRVGYRWIGLLLFTIAFSLFGAAPAQAEDCVADHGGVIDGFVNPVAPSQIQIDGNCTIKNFPASNPLTSNISWFGSSPASMLLIFDNVVHTGNMACNLNAQGNKIWFVNSASTSVQDHCLSLLIPVEKINKQNPAGQTAATIGIPFTYRLTIPVLFDPATGNVINSSGSPNDLHGITVWDDLNTTGADLRYVSHVAYWLNDPTRAPIPHTFSNVGGALTFDNFPIVPAGQQFVIEVTVVLNDTPANVPGRTFYNTARWDFGRLIGGVFYEPLPGERGVTPPMTISAPVLVAEKSGPATMNLGQWGNFAIDIQNVGLTGAWNAIIRDFLPDIPSGGMCDLTPEILSIQVFLADGVTSAPGKGPLNPGSDYSMSYLPAPNCRIEITLLTAAGAIGPNERLIIRYRTQLDANTRNGVELTNVAGALQWFNGDTSNPDRQPYTRDITGGTEDTPDNQDAHTVTVALAGYVFEKTVANLTSGVNPATTAAPGNRLRYTLRLRTTNEAITDFRIFDDLDALNAQPAFVPSTLTLVSTPAGADISGTSSTGGSKGTGVIDVRLSVPAASEVLVVYDITLASNLSNSTVVTNQSTLRLVNGTIFALSDDPNVNGTANPDISGDEDPTRVTIITVPLPTGYFFEKTAANLTSGVNPATTAAPGNRLRYTLRLRTTNEAIPDFRIFDDLDALNAQPAFVPSTLTLVSTPAGADISGTSSTGGSKGTGVIDVRLSVPAASEVLVVYDITLASNLSNSTVVTNQSTLRLVNGTIFALSDDPNVNGPANPDISGDEDPTRVTIITVPLPTGYFFEKTAANLTSGVNPATTAAPGNRLRYTLRLRTTNEAIPDFRIFDDLDALNAQPAFVPSTLTLVSTPAGADISGTSSTGGSKGTGVIDVRLSVPAASEVLVVYDITLASNLSNSTVVTNQSTLRLVNGTIFALSDDPNVNGPANPDISGDEDPTRVTIVTGNLLYAEKRASLLVDRSSPGVVDPGDVLRYTITVQNSAAIPSTGVVLRDSVPANTTYVTDSTTLNGLPVGQPDGGAPPLASGIDISSPDLTPPLPGPSAGTISPGATAVLQFEVRINDGTPVGTVISNQALVESVELPDLLTDGDGNPATGPEPTVVVVGEGQQLSITKQVTVIGGGAALPGAQVEYVVRVANIAAVPAINVVITDDLDASQPGQLSYVNGTATMDGSPTGVTFAGSTITANYATVNGSLAPGEAVVLRFRATLSANLAGGTVVTNTGVVAWNDPTQNASASVSTVVVGASGSAVLSGSAWHDADFDDTQDPGERALVGWSADLYRDGQLVHSVVTDAAGAYSITGVEPNNGSGSVYELRFRAPGAGANTATLGSAVSPFTNGPQRIAGIIVTSGANLQGLNLPIHPNGVIYDSVARIPIPGAALVLLAAGSRSPLPASCFDDTAQQGQITLTHGYYKFDINFSDPAICPSGADYLIEVTPPAGSNYLGGYSRVIPPASDASTAGFSVPACPASVADAIPATALFCEVQGSESAPSASVAPRSAGTIHHVHVILDNSQSPGSSQIFNNHIPLDSQILGSFAISKTTPLLNVTRGQLVPYVITVNNIAGLMVTDVSIVDRFPAGFGYVEGSATLDGVPIEPSIAGRELRWNGLVIGNSQVHTVRLLLAVGAGVSEGEYMNRAQVLNGTTDSALSGEATATVRIVPDPVFDCTDVTGRVFNDVNRNGVQDSGENGLPGVHVVTARGLRATTDQFGRYHVTCAITPNESRGSNLVLKLDDRSLPSGFRLSTDQIQIKRVTRGKAASFNFGASIYRVVAIDLSDAVFEPDTTEMRVQWRPRLDLLLEELRKAPAVLRLSYIADTEDAALVERRVQDVKRQLTQAWQATTYSYVLTIEPEVFWRLGGRPKQADVRVPGSR